MKPAIINVIEVIYGVLEATTSFIIPNKFKAEGQHDIVHTAEALFIQLAKQHGLKDEDVDEALDSGNYDDGNGYDIYLNWSQVQ